jgi:hypothetical protein
MQVMRERIDWLTDDLAPGPVAESPAFI